MSSEMYIGDGYYADPSVWLTSFEDKRVRNGIATTTLFIMALIVGTITDYVAGQLVERTGLSGTDRVLGICFDALHGMLIIVTVLFFLDTFIGVAKSDDWHQSQFIPCFTPVIR